jgi:hypothetical protein
MKSQLKAVMDKVFDISIVEELKIKTTHDLLIIQEDFLAAAEAMQKSEDEWLATEYWDMYWYATEELKARGSV